MARKDGLTTCRVYFLTWLYFTNLLFVFFCVSSIQQENQWTCFQAFTSRLWVTSIGGPITTRVFAPVSYVMVLVLTRVSREVGRASCGFATTKGPLQPTWRLQELPGLLGLNQTPWCFKHSWLDIPPFVCRFCRFVFPIGNGRWEPLLCWFTGGYNMMIVIRWVLPTNYSAKEGFFGLWGVNCFSVWWRCMIWLHWSINLQVGFTNEVMVQCSNFTWSSFSLNMFKFLKGNHIINSFVAGVYTVGQCRLI